MRRFSERAFRDSGLKRLSTGGDRRQRIVDFMDDAGGQTPNGSELLSARDGAFRFHPGSNVLANCDDVRHLVRLVGVHRYFADEPVVSVAGLRNRLLLDAVNFTGREYLVEFALQ